MSAGVSGLALALLAAVALAHGRDDVAPSVAVQIRPPTKLETGDRTEVRVEVTIRPDQGHPVLLTPRSEGTALEVVRGRLLRLEANDGGEARGTLQFDVPVVARSPGTAVFRAKVLAYHCRDLCEAYEAEDQAVLTVHRK